MSLRFTRRMLLARFRWLQRAPATTALDDLILDARCELAAAYLARSGGGL